MTKPGVELVSFWGDANLPFEEAGKVLFGEKGSFGEGAHRGAVRGVGSDKLLHPENAIIMWPPHLFFTNVIRKQITENMVNEGRAVSCSEVTLVEKVLAMEALKHLGVSLNMGSDMGYRHGPNQGLSRLMGSIVIEKKTKGDDMGWVSRVLLSRVLNTIGDKDNSPPVKGGLYPVDGIGALSTEHHKQVKIINNPGGNIPRRWNLQVATHMNLKVGGDLDGP